MVTSLNNQTPARDAGTQSPYYLRREFTFSDVGRVLTVGTLPAGAQMLHLQSGVYVDVAFNHGTNNLIDIGTTADDDLYGTNISVATIAFVALDEAIGATGVTAFYVSSDTTITATPDFTGTAGTAGRGRVVIAYLPAN